MEQYLPDQNQLHIFDNDNFSISCKNADLSAVDNFFDNIAHPLLWIRLNRLRRFEYSSTCSQSLRDNWGC